MKSCLKTNLSTFLSLISLAGIWLTAAARGAEAAPGTDTEVLLDLLLEKGLISAQDADKVRAELAGRASQSADEFAKRSKLHFAKWMDAIQLYGDARLRFEQRGGEDGTGPGDDRLERTRWRYRLRGGLKMEFTDHLRAGIQLETGQGGRSANVTFGGDDGPWGKSADGLYLGLLYLNWTPADWLGVTAGRQSNPFFITSLVWDGDLAPEGLTESFKVRTGKLDLFATFGQYLYDDSDSNNVFGAGPNFSDAYLFVNQVGARFDLAREVTLQVAPVLNVYSGPGDSFRGPFVGATPANSTGINDLLLLEIPAELKFKVSSLPARVFGDFAVNLQGAERARAAGTPQFTEDVDAWLAGVELGSARKKGGWNFRAVYQMSGLYALDPNLVDSDTFDLRLNMKGFVVQGTYALTDFANLTVTYANAERNNRALPTGAVGDLGGKAGTAYLENYQLFQADLTFKF